MNQIQTECAKSWIDWARERSVNATYVLDARDWLQGKDANLIGYLIQACAEQPEAFARAFEPLLGNKQTNPLTVSGEGVLLNLVHNGVCDDWEIFLQWRESGYVVVNEIDRQPQDARLGFSQAHRLLDILTGGPVMAPGAANEAALIQGMYETEKPPIMKRKIV